jgi:three-Cys-motif partner protein
MESRFASDPDNEGSGVSGDKDDRQYRLPLPARQSFLPFRPQPKLRRLQHPVWTENKAKLIERYLYYFVLITHHGTYIDGFAGPQQPELPETWAAKLVLESEPKWFRHFYLFDNEAGQAAALERLRDCQPVLDSKGKKLNRDVSVCCADFNDAVHELLGRATIGQKEAAFCLIDQRTFQCHWSTLHAISQYKRESEHKIEIFYFFAYNWIKRALSALTRNRQQLAAWWGRDDWSKLAEMRTQSILEAMLSRFRDELRYETATPWPIYERESGGRIMYYMIHATDHPEAPHLMARAYEKAVQPKETPEQLGFFCDMDLPDAGDAVT